jgi:Lysyl oxidase
MTTELTKRNGTPIKGVTREFCPNDWQPERIDDGGPVTPTFPFFCWASPFTRGMVLGIDQGWSTKARTTLGRHLKIDPGTYQLSISIAEPYRTAFGISAENAEVSVPVIAIEENGRLSQRQAARTTTAPEAQTERTSAPIGTPPDSALPDLEALPAYGIRIDNMRKSGRSFMSFGATAWNAGPGPLVVEGFRDPAQSTMDAFQYFYDNGDPVSKLPAGQLAYDNRDGHDHWHFKDFAAYSLLNSNMTKVLDSGKEAFCLAPTDPIDLTINGAEWRPWLTDLGTACGEEGSLWIREVLEAGWGDTYAQYRPGQSFEITNLPNGTYYIRVLANPDDVLLEGSSTNNEALRMVKVHGKPGARWVEVPPYGLIDSEGADCGYFC